MEKPEVSFSHRLVIHAEYRKNISDKTNIPMTK